MPIDTSVTINLGTTSLTLENAIPDDEGKVDVYNEGTAIALRMVEYFGASMNAAMDDEQKDIAELNLVNTMPNWQISDWTAVASTPTPGPSATELQMATDRTKMLADMSVIRGHAMVPYTDINKPSVVSYAFAWYPPLAYAGSFPGNNVAKPEFQANSLMVSQDVPPVTFYVDQFSRAWQVDASSLQPQYGNEAVVSYTDGAGNTQIAHTFYPPVVGGSFPGYGKLTFNVGLRFSTDDPPVIYYADPTSRVCYRVDSITPFYQPVNQAELDGWKSNQQKMITDLTALSQNKQILLQDQITSLSTWLAFASNAQERKSHSKADICGRFY